jgi:opacity protein-like surface antigen
MKKSIVAVLFLLLVSGIANAQHRHGNDRNDRDDRDEHHHGRDHFRHGSEYSLSLTGGSVLGSRNFFQGPSISLELSRHLVKSTYIGIELLYNSSGDRRNSFGPGVPQPVPAFETDRRGGENNYTAGALLNIRNNLVDRRAKLFIEAGIGGFLSKGSSRTEFSPQGTLIQRRRNDASFGMNMGIGAEYGFARNLNAVLQVNNYNLLGRSRDEADGTKKNFTTLRAGVKFIF